MFFINLSKNEESNYIPSEIAASLLFNVGITNLFVFLAKHRVAK